MGNTNLFAELILGTPFRCNTIAEIERLVLRAKTGELEKIFFADESVAACVDDRWQVAAIPAGGNGARSEAADFVAEITARAQ